VAHPVAWQHRPGRHKPATSTTQFAEARANGLDRELIARKASDLISPHAGETGQNLAMLFNRNDPARSLLLHDQVNSFLANRADTRHQWERTHVNELLKRMGRFTGILRATTNRTGGISATALHRFDLKPYFQPFQRELRVALFAWKAIGDSEPEVPALASRHPAELGSITAGKLANVCRPRASLKADWTPEHYLGDWWLDVG
jgi:transitional endoplasmic reticulum ATPase